MPIDPATKALLIIILAYLVGSIPFGYLVAHLWGGVDIREHGSGNIGATNVWRTLGRIPGLVTLLLDFSKGLLPVTLTLWTVPLEDFSNNGFLWASVVCLVGLAAILGHAFPVWFLFRGGKMVATGLGVMAALIGPWVLVPLLVFGMVVTVTRYVSLGSILAALTIPIIFVMGLYPEYQVFPKSDPAGNKVFVAFAFLAAIFVVVKHRSNLRRLANGTEPRVGSGTRTPDPGASRL
ncbi:MAG TPA: glycerol-3-phosphate 1-O-acyltransferase PlsY, partial [bacterium]|nr:glycerol-3-phosphate 1-O-acyltransferase PlsY [bacterium]